MIDYIKACLQPPVRMTMPSIPVSKFKDFFKYYKGTPNQEAAIDDLYKVMPVSLLQDDADWIKLYREPEPAPEVEEGICTPELMAKLTPHPASSFDAVFCNDCNRLFRETGFSAHLDAMQMLMANMMHETCDFVYMKEIASGVAYNNRADLGNGPNDGPKYKGAGVLQLTGKYNYTKLSQGINDPKVMDGVDYVADTYPFTSARIWIEENNLLSVCLTQGFDQCCVRINGGWNGYDDRLNKYHICQKHMK